MWTSYPGFEGQKDLGQKQDKAFQADGDELQHKIGDSHHPDQVKEVIAVEVGSGKYETGGGKNCFTIFQMQNSDSNNDANHSGNGMKELKKDKEKKNSQKNITK